MRDFDKKILTQLQRGIEITSRPFQCLENVDAVSSPRFPESEAIDNFAGSKITTNGSGSCLET